MISRKEHAAEDAMAFGDVYIVGAARIPFGKFGGSFRTAKVAELGGHAIQALIKNTGVPPEMVEKVIVGNVLSAAQSQHTARQASQLGGIPDSAPAEHVEKVCASSLLAIMRAADDIALDRRDVVAAVGMECMSAAPYTFTKIEKKMGDYYVLTFKDVLSAALPVRILDSMLHDGLMHPELLDPREPLMGELADECAEKFGISREEQEAYAVRSIRRALRAEKDGYFAPSPAPGTPQHTMVKKDETIRPVKLKKMQAMEPCFSKGGTVTVATSSQVADGAAAILAASDYAIMKSQGDLTPLARIAGFAEYSHDPRWYTTAPVGAIGTLLEERGHTVHDVDLFEINEAFAVVVLHTMRALGIPKEKVNVWGGAISLGHPIGASGARIVGNLALQLQMYKKRFGIAVACNGCGEALAVLLENEDVTI